MLTVEKKMDKLAYDKMKNFCLSKGSIMKMKRQPIENSSRNSERYLYQKYVKNSYKSASEWQLIQ